MEATRDRLSPAQLHVALDRLSPTQRQVALEVARAAEHVPVVRVSSSHAGAGHIVNGKGISTIMHALVDMMPAAAIIDVKASVQGEARLHFPAAVRGFDAFITACLKAWETAHVLVVDDIDLAASPNTIYSVRLGTTGESFGFYQTAAEPTLAVKLLSGHAISNQKWLPLREREVLTKAGVEMIWRQYPQLSAADLLVACVPVTSSASDGIVGDEKATQSCVSQSGAPDLANSPPAVLARIADRLSAAHGSVALDKIDLMEVHAMPGLKDVMKQIEKHVLLPFEQPEIAERFNAKPKHGVLLYGPPGTGKTSIGRALAHRLRGKMFMVKELNLHRELLVTFAAAEANAPSVVFIDDIDVLMQRDMVQYGHQSDVFRFLLAKLDGLASQHADQSHVVVIMACNNVKMLPEPLLRSGRIELWLKTELPKLQVRQQILEQYVREDADLMSADLSSVAMQCDGFTPADLKRVVMDTRNLLATQYLENMGKETNATPTTNLVARQDVTVCMLDAVKELKAMKANVEYLIQGMYT